MSNTPMSTIWKITFTNPDGESRTTEILWTDTQPTRTEVAGVIRDRLLKGVLFKGNNNRESSQHTEALLEHHGYTITGIEKR
jgi:hypothetical protein